MAPAGMITERSASDVDDVAFDFNVTLLLPFVSTLSIPVPTPVVVLLLLPPPLTWGAGLSLLSNKIPAKKWQSCSVRRRYKTKWNSFAVVFIIFGGLGPYSVMQWDKFHYYRYLVLL